jgi:hypothetical protein
MIRPMLILDDAGKLVPTTFSPIRTRRDVWMLQHVPSVSSEILPKESAWTTVILIQQGSLTIRPGHASSTVLVLSTLITSQEHALPSVPRFLNIMAIILLEYAYSTAQLLPLEIQSWICAWLSAQTVIMVIMLLGPVSRSVLLVILEIILLICAWVRVPLQEHILEINFWVFV